MTSARLNEIFTQVWIVYSHKCIASAASCVCVRVCATELTAGRPPSALPPPRNNPPPLPSPLRLCPAGPSPHTHSYSALRRCVRASSLSLPPSEPSPTPSTTPGSRGATRRRRRPSCASEEGVGGRGSTPCSYLDQGELRDGDAGRAVQVRRGWEGRGPHPVHTWIKGGSLPYMLGKHYFRSGASGCPPLSPTLAPSPPPPNSS